MSDDRLMSIKEAVAYIRVVSRATLYREMDDGKLAYSQIRSRRFIYQSELDRYLVARAKARAA